MESEDGSSRPHCLQKAFDGFRVHVSVCLKVCGMCSGNEGLHKFIITNVCLCVCVHGLLRYSDC